MLFNVKGKVFTAVKLTGQEGAEIYSVLAYEKLNGLYMEIQADYPVVGSYSNVKIELEEYFDDIGEGIEWNCAVGIFADVEITLWVKTELEAFRILQNFYSEGFNADIANVYVDGGDVIEIETQDVTSIECVTSIDWESPAIHEGTEPSVETLEFTSELIPFDFSDEEEEEEEEGTGIPSRGNVLVTKYQALA